MLDLASLGTTTHVFAFGGVGFEISAEPGVCWQLSPDFARHATELANAPVAATVRCVVRVDPALPDGRTRGLILERGQLRTSVCSGELRAELWPLTAARYQANATIAPYREGATVQGPDAVVGGLAAAIIEQRAGASMHAAAIELGGCGVLLLGPSGAGKSTAVRLIEGARVFAFDRVSVGLDSSGGYSAWSLPGGSPVAAPPSARRSLPIAAMLRIRQGRGTPRISRLTGGRAVFAVRESTEVGDISAGAEELRMNTASELAAQVVVGELETVLGAPHRKLVHDFLIANARGYARAMTGGAHVEL